MRNIKNHESAQTPSRRYAWGMAIGLVFATAPQLCIDAIADSSVGNTAATPITGSVTGTIHDSLRRNGVGVAPTAITYPPPGSIVMSAQQYCGDGMVASFAPKYPNITFANYTPSTQTLTVVQGTPAPTPPPGAPTVIGYWVGPAGVKTTPTAANWFPLATVNLVPGNAPTATASQVNRVVSPSTAASFIVSQALYNLELNSGYVMPASATTPPQYAIYVGGMLCANYTGSTNTSSNDMPLPHEITGAFGGTSIIGTIDGNVKTALTSPPPFTNLATFQVAYTDAPPWVTTSLGSSYANQSNNNNTDQLITAATTLMSLSWSSGTGASVLATNTTLQSQLAQLDSDMTTQTTCNKVTGVQSPTGGKFFWEHYDLQRTCGMLDGQWNQTGLGLTTFHQAYNTFLGTSDATSFATAQIILAAQLYRAGLMQEIELAFQNQYQATLQPTLSCVDFTQPVVNTAMGSLPIDTAVPAPSPTPAPFQKVYNSTTPDGSFGNGTVVNQFLAGKKLTQAQADQNFIFSTGGDNAPMVIGPTYPPNDPSKTPTAAAVSILNKISSAAYTLNFNVRGLGCANGVSYCSVDKPFPFPWD